MATKFAEIALAMHFRVQDEEGNFRGGVMERLAADKEEVVRQLRDRPYGCVHLQRCHGRGGKALGYLLPQESAV